MKKETFIEKTPAELSALLTEKREALRVLRFSAAGARAKDPSASPKLRKDIARILTALTAQSA